MKLKTFAAIDTNVLVSAAIRQKGTENPPYKVLSLVKSKNVIPLFDERMLREYNDVLHYDKFLITEQDIYDTLYPIVENGILINDVEAAKKLFKDNSDIPFYEVTMSSSEFDSHLVTGNLKHFPKASYIVEPRTMIEKMEYMDKFLATDLYYDKTISDLMHTQTSSSKYTSGKELIDDIFDTKDKTINLESRILRLQSDTQQLKNHMYIDNSPIDGIVPK